VFGKCYHSLGRVWWNPVFLTAQARKSLDGEKWFLRKEVSLPYHRCPGKDDKESIEESWFRLIGGARKRGLKAVP